MFTIGVTPFATLSVPIDNVQALTIIGLQAAVFALQYRLFFQLQRVGGPVYLSLLGSVAAIVGSAIAVGLLGESLPDGVLPAGLLIAAGVALLTFQRTETETPR